MGLNGSSRVFNWVLKVFTGLNGFEWVFKVLIGF